MEKDLTKLLVIAPHPDDEINLAGSIIYNLTKKKEKIKVVYTTNGDFFSKESGEVRIKETIDALNILKMSKEDIYFLGYGDNWNEELHLYNSPEDKIITSMAGLNKTYSLKENPEYRYLKSGYHNSYTRNNYKKDLKELILDIKAETIICVDFDNHPDHKATSLFFEEIMGEILKETSYKPIILKKFAYNGVWFGENDYYNNYFAETKISIEKIDDDYELEVPSYSWKERIRLEVPNEAKTPLVKKNIMYKVAAMHKSQKAKFRIPRIINDDIVYFLRRTDSILYNAEIEVSSGEKKYLNDFKLIDSSNIKKERGKLEDILDKGIWIPDEEDIEKVISIVFNKKEDIERIVLYENFDKSSHIEELLIQFDNGYKQIVSSINNLGKATIIDIEKQKNIKKIKIQILKFKGNRPGFSEIEIYNNAEYKNIYLIEEKYKGIKNINKKYKLKKIIERISIKLELKILRYKKKINSRYKKLKKLLRRMRELWK